ncbi:mannose-1-phosphate guanylyltransferase/mannose-6-phosphate isomerase [Thiomonas arsenitoxydans]|uniref:mannose-1-phosphate guanylyltransferase/mannose-6-phosphate isomerase n=1 Tax=Thiomonas arsenitoxydans (strain DSM 22701 / CIP 110005 / 3As) TaxID=426114 RepID=UPI001AD0A12A|nr:mannose-1-phosphate guanylyltransferase/mannose-6-phosphate isomerase [Thiomonas arsenitoxydans]MBN8777129.1 mannose-1-phosphate guanylyltransferase/mannose-6-phosphate isomerase [Thiomonas arsenitoxydans]
MSTCQKLLPVILSGGAGTRLWPVSREQHPKPFMQLADGQSLLQKTFLRAAALPGVEQILTVTNRDLVFKTKDEYAQVNPTAKATAYILEPFGRNTAPALAAAALWAEQHLGPDATLLVLAADHLITKQEAFAAAVSQACALAAQGKMVTFGIQPTAPETGFGYIEAEGNTVLRFVEKPTLAKASEFLSSGRYLWNSGIFCFRVDAVLRELSEHAPNVLESVQNCLGASAEVQGGGISQVEMRPEAFEYAPDISIDYALMEPSAEVAVVPCDIGWSDIGSWNALSDLQDADAQGNRILGEALLHDARNCYVQSPQRIVGLVGVHDLIVVDTPDAVLVADRSRAQDVKQITAQLKASGHDAYKIHREVHRPWGTYTVLEEAEDFKIKRIVVKPKGTLSLQMHHHRSEHWIVVSGIARVINGETETLVRTNESTYIPAGIQHRLENPGILDLVMIEVQSGAYLGEDDIVRFEDAYGRA